MGNRVEAIKFYTQAKQNPQQNQQLVYQLLSSAAVADPTMAQALYEVGAANGQMWLNPGAVALYRRVLELPYGTNPGDLDPITRVKTLTNMGFHLYVMGNYHEASEVLLQALELDPENALAMSNLALVNTIWGNHKLAVELAADAHRRDPSSVAIEVSFGFALLHAGDWAKGLKHFEARFPYRMQHFLGYPYPKWDGTPKKTLFLQSEQGMGDALSFARFVPLAAARCEFIHVVVQKELLRLFRALFQHLHNVEIIPNPSPFLPADYWSTFMSLPAHMGLSNDEIAKTPFPALPEFRINPTWKVPGRQRHIAVAWHGHPGGDINHHKSFPFEHLLELYRVPGIQLYSIQVGDAAADLHKAGAASIVRDLAPLITDVADTMAILQHMDMAITVESLPMHIAATLGVETWVPYSYRGRDWRITTRKNLGWYKTQRIFQQTEDARWEPVFAEIVNALNRESYGEKAA